MMDYFKKIGRPTDEERAVINMIEGLIKDKGVPRSEIPQCQTLDDLLEVQNLLEAYVSKKEDVKSEPIKEQAEEIEATQSDQVELVEQEVDISHPIEGEITQESEEVLSPDLGQENENSLEEIEDEQSVSAYMDEVQTEKESVPTELGPNFISDDYDPFSEEIKERSYTSQDILKMEDSDSTDLQPDELDQDDLNLEELEETPVDDLNPNSKRKIAEKTASSLLKGYAKLAPQPFIWMAKINESNIENLAFEGELDINLEVSEGTTFDDYMKQTNEQIDEIFEVEEETLDEIKEPLIEVLMEQKMELTPQQRLAMAVVSHLFQMFTLALSLRRQNNRILEYQKRMTMMAAQTST